MDMQRYGPPDASAATGPADGATFLRLPLVAEPGGVDVAVVGLPLDCAVPGVGAPGMGAGLGPRAVRESSLALRTAYNPSQRVAPFKEMSVVDAGDASVVAGADPASLDAVQAALAPWLEGGVTPLGLGGDSVVLLAELRAAAAVHGPLALLSFDAHIDGDAGMSERPSRSTVVRAAEEGLIDPRRSTVMGMRGGLSSAGGYDEARELGLTIVPWDDLAQLGTGVVSQALENARGEPSCRSTCTSSIRPSRRPPAGPRAADPRRLRHWPCCEPAAGSTSPPPT